MRKYFLSIFFITTLTFATLGAFFVVVHAQTADEIKQFQLEEEARLKAEAEAAQQRALEEARLQAEEEAKRKAEAELKTKISEKGSTIEKLEQEIAQYNKEIVSVQAKSKTLSTTIKQLDLTKEKLLTDISVTNNKIESTNYTIDKIKLDIDSATTKIEMNNEAIAEMMRNLDELEDRSFVEVLLSANDLTEIWRDIDTIQQFRGVVSKKLIDLDILKQNLESKKLENEEHAASLQELEVKLGDQKTVVEVTKKEKSTLLQTTKNTEAEYQKKLKEKKAAKEALEKEIAEYESQLKFILDQNSLPKLGSGVLGWPLKDVSLGSCYDGSGKGHANCITQYFGNTAFAQSGAYNGKGHNGIDFNATIGEAVLSSADGVIQATGDTDQYKGCYSYGQWVLVRHLNGLTTLYAHLSLIKVKNGQSVKQGQLIGYSGNTGYSTGPHLHYSVFASEGVEVVRLGDVKKITNCAQPSIPVAAYNAYLNPLNYLAK